MPDLRDSNLADLVGEITDAQDATLGLPEELAVLPLRGSVLFPGVVMQRRGIGAADH